MYTGEFTSFVGTTLLCVGIILMFKEMGFKSSHIMWIVGVWAACIYFTSYYPH
jgi:uncharacterized membrane protein HdeD (DUF308 family)